MDDDQLERMAQEFEEAPEPFLHRVLEDFRYDEVQGKYWCLKTGSLLTEKTVNGAIPHDEWPTRPDGRSGEPRPVQPASVIREVDTGLTVQAATWWPGRPLIMENEFVNEDGARRIRGARTLNLYTAPKHDLSGAKPDAQPWIEHLRRIYPDPLEHEHFLDFCAHAMQRPDEKVNHGLVMGGRQGIGKDTLLSPIRWGVGEWNTSEIDPDDARGKYNHFVKSVMLVINEVRPHEENFHAANFYNKLKPLLASPPEMLPMEVKYANVVHVRNLAHVVLTTNDMHSMYVPPEDRRLFMMDSPLECPATTPGVFPDGYFDELHEWLDNGGREAVVQMLLDRDLSDFSAQSPPPMTDSKAAIVDIAHQVRSSDFDDFFDHFKERYLVPHNVNVFFHADLVDFVQEMDLFDDKEEVLGLLKKKSTIHRLQEAGWRSMRCPDGYQWRKGKFRSRNAYYHESLSREEAVKQLRAALNKRPITFGLAAVQDNF